MQKRVYTFVISFSLSLALLAQNKCYTLIDTLTNEPIPYCNIVLENNQGFTTNHLGEFCVKTSENISSIEISNISYYQKNITLNDYDSNIYLHPKHYKLNSIDINWRKYKFTWLGNKFKKPDSYIHLWRFCQIGLHLPPLKKEKNGIIESVSIPIQNTSDQKVPFRLHIYSTDSNKQIGTELLPENVYGQVQDNYELVTIDVLNYQIEIPKNGVFVTIELLSNNKPEELQIGTKKYSELNNNRIAVTEARYQHRKMLKASSWKLNSFYIEKYPFTNVKGMYGELPMIKVKVRENRN